jgi:GT2 family glycosyltransferase
MDMGSKGAILTTTRNSSHIWRYFERSYRQYCEGYDLFVWDNGSREGDQEYLETYQQDGVINNIFLSPVNHLFTYAANELLECAHMTGYEQYIIANPDIEFREGWDRDVETNEGIMGFVLVKPNGLIEHAGGIGGGDHTGRGEKDAGQYQELRDVDWVTFGAVAISRRAFEELGKLDQRFPHFGSDREYCALAKAKGIPVRCSGARLTHFYGWACRPYIWRDIPEDIWKAHVKERHDAGVFFPEDQNRIPRIDSTFKVSVA